MKGGIMNKMKTVREIAEDYQVTEIAVRKWLKKGLPYKIEKVIGIKPRIVIDPKDVEQFLKLGIRKNNRIKN